MSPQGQLLHEGAAKDRQVEDVKHTVKCHILQLPGPFTTPQAVYKTVRFSLRGQAQEHAASLMKSMSEEGIGVYIPDVWSQ